MFNGNVVVHKTNDADIFKKLTGNRDVKGVERIIKSINKVGYIINPILVNENMEVIDGQNRLEAFSQLGLPIYYIVQDGLGLEECRALNIGQMNWKTEDYIDSYAAVGNQSYMYLKALLTEFKKDFKVEPVTMVADTRICFTDNRGCNSGIKEGRFEMNQKQYELARTRLNSMKNLGFLQLARDYHMGFRSYWAAVIYAYLHQDVEVKELVRKLRENPMLMVSYSKTADQLRMFDEAYNKNRKRSDKKVFMSADYQKKLYMEK